MKNSDVLESQLRKKNFNFISVLGTYLIWNSPHPNDLQLIKDSKMQNNLIMLESIRWIKLAFRMARMGFQDVEPKRLYKCSQWLVVRVLLVEDWLAPCFTILNRTALTLLTKKSIWPPSESIQVWAFSRSKYSGDLAAGAVWVIGKHFQSQYILKE